MRAAPLVALLLLASLAPVAEASPTSLALELPEGPVEGNTTVPVVVRLTISEFMCHEDVELRLPLAVNATEGVKAVFAQSSVVLHVPARSYFVNGYEGTATVDLTVRAIASGRIDLFASFSQEELASCFSSDGFAPAVAVVSREVVLPDAPAPAAPEPPTPASPAAPTPASPAPTPAMPAARPTACAPDTTCGAIGEYDAQESGAQPDADNGTPGLGAIGALVALTLVALLARRR